MEDERWRRGFEELSIARIVRGDVVESQTGRCNGRRRVGGGAVFGIMISSQRRYLWG